MQNWLFASTKFSLLQTLKFLQWIVRIRVYILYTYTLHNKPGVDLHDFIKRCKESFGNVKGCANFVEGEHPHERNLHPPEKVAPPVITCTPWSQEK